MNRRTFLAAASCGGLSALAGCNALPFSNTEPDESNNSTTTPVDSDLDGVPDTEDYAPWDDAVQNKSDVFDEYWGVNISPDDPSQDEQPVQAALGRRQQSGVHELSAQSDDGFFNSMSAFTQYGTDGAMVRIHANDAPETAARLLVVAREFPRRGVVGWADSDTLNPGYTGTASVEFDESFQTDDVLNLSAFLIPDRDIEEVADDKFEFLHETNPFSIQNGTAEAETTEYELDDVSGESYSRTTVEGGYTISLSGRSQGRDFALAYFVSQSAYERKRMEPKGRSREEYVRYALSNGTGTSFVDVVKEGARNAGFSSRDQQAEFAIDVVQSFPYVLDSVGTGFDDYTKFIEETMVEISGDCEDSTIALAILLSELGYDVVLVEFPSHIGIGIAGDHSGSYISYGGTQYHYVETTSEGWAIGDVPRELDTSEVMLSAV